MNDMCPDCGGILILREGTTDQFRAWCELCNSVWETDEIGHAWVYTVLVVVLWVLAGVSFGGYW